MAPACCRSVTVATTSGCGNKHVDQTGLWEVTAVLEILRAVQKEQQHILRTVILERKNIKISKERAWYFLRMLSKYPIACSSDVSRCSPSDLKAFHEFSFCNFVCWFFEPRHLFSRDATSPVQILLHAFVTLCAFPSSSRPLKSRTREHGTDWW